MRNNPEIPNELYYLDDDFSVRSLRKYQLKEILAANNIPYLSSITRSDLINLFKKNIEPRREEILKEYKAKQSQMKKESNQETYGRGRRVISKPVKYSDDDLSVSSSEVYQKDSDGFKIPSVPKKRSPPQFNAEDSFASSDDDDHHYTQPVTKLNTNKRAKKAKETVKKTNKNRKLPKFNAEDSFASSGEDEVEAEEEEDYQPVKKKRVYQEEMIENELLDTQVIEEDDDTDYHGDTDDDDEEDEEDIGQIDRDELVMLYKDQSQPPEVFISSAYCPDSKHQRIARAANYINIWKTRLTRIFYAFCTLYMMCGSLGLFITSIARKNNGYCDNFPKGLNRTEPHALTSILPSYCIPCPDHGICKDGNLVCDTLYEKKTPIYNLGHVFPIADDCVHNSVLGKYVGKVERHIKQKLAAEQGKAMCEHLLAHPDSSEEIPPIRVAVKDILADLNATVKSHLPKERMQEILVIGLSSVLEDPKVHYWEIDNERYMGTEYVKYSLSCQAKRFFRLIPLKVKISILVLAVFITLMTSVFQYYKKKMARKQKIVEMMKSITEKLKQQHENHIKEPIKYPSPAVSVSELRSSIVDVNNHKTIDDWKEVLNQMKTHPHIRRSFQEIRGDPIEFWELTT